MSTPALGSLRDWTSLLPKECLAMIWQYLPFNQYIQMREVSPYWAQIYDSPINFPFLQERFSRQSKTCQVKDQASHCEINIPTEAEIIAYMYPLIRDPNETLL